MPAVGANYVLSLGYVANEALTGKRFVKGVAAEDKAVDQADTQGEEVLGVAQYDVTAAQATDDAAVAVGILGVAVVEAGAIITQYARVTTGADGRAEPAAIGDVVAGIALTGSGAAGEWINVLLTPGGPTVA